jgi:hypothetical protein
MIASSDINPGFDLPEFLWDGPKSNKAKHGKGDKDGEKCV